MIDKEREIVMSTELSNRVAAETRASFGKGAARRLRAAGQIPAVIYGHGSEPRHIALPGHQVTLLLRKANQVLELTFDGDEALALVKDVQRDPVRQIIEHIDLIVIRKGEKVHVDVQVVLEGETAPGTHVLQDGNSILVEVEATHIPERFTLDISGLEAGAHLTAADITLPAGTTLLSDPETLILQVTGETAAEDESEAAAE